MSSFDIAGIGSNPYMMSPLANYGLGVGGTFSSYPMMSMMGMAGGYGGMSGYPGMGMMGMYNPAFMGQMTQTMHDIERAQLNQASAMHNLMKENQLEAYKVHDKYLFEKSMVDSAVQGSIVNLANVIQNGDADAICEEYDKLKSELYTKYHDYFEKHNDLDPSTSIRQHIEELYSAIISKKAGQSRSLRSDIERFGESAFAHGFNSKFFGNKGYHDKYTEETLSYLYDTRIDSKGRKDRAEKIGGYIGKGAEMAAAPALGYGAAIAASGLLKLLNPFNCCKNLTMKGMHRFGKIGAFVALAADIAWQCSRD